MVEVGEVRRMALSLPEAVEQGHHGMPSFRVANKIFATVPDNEHLHVMVGPDEADMAVSAAPQAFEELLWGVRRAGVRVKLAEADPDLLSVLLGEAWRRRAPRRLASLLDSSTVSNTGPSVITGDLGVSPGSAVTGFPPGVVIGTIHAADGLALQLRPTSPPRPKANPRVIGIFVVIVGRRSNNQGDA